MAELQDRLQHGGAWLWSATRPCGRSPEPVQRRAVEQREVTVVELARIADVRECCGERYLLVEQQRGSLVRRWFTREDDLELPLSACPRCAAPLLPHTHVTSLEHISRAGVTTAVR
jgi:hypothetical protein